MNAALPLTGALEAWAVEARRLARITSGSNELGNRAWHVWTRDGRHLVARRYTVFRSGPEVEYELQVLRHLGMLGWSVSAPVAGVVEHDGRQHSLCTYVAGGPCDDGDETSRRRGVLLARLHSALLTLRDQLGQRPCWRAQPVVDDPRFEPQRRAGLEALRSADPELADEVERAHSAALAELDRLQLGELPTFLLHGDFTTANVRQRRRLPIGIIDFDLCHVGNRPWELAIARIQRAPAMLDGYRTEAGRLGIPLTAHEERALPGVYRAFRAGMISWSLVEGAHRGFIDRDFVHLQLRKLRLGLGR